MRGAVAFVSPKEMEVTLDLPHKGTLSGMGIRKGITLIVGEGYHGKSTLLKALELGVYDHIAGDGREYVITDATAVNCAPKTEEASNRRIFRCSSMICRTEKTPDILHGGCQRKHFSGGECDREYGSRAKALLIDEDTSATNFMIRDELMQRVIHRKWNRSRRVYRTDPGTV